MVILSLNKLWKQSIVLVLALIDPHRSAISSNSERDDSCKTIAEL